MLFFFVAQLFLFMKKINFILLFVLISTGQFNKTYSQDYWFNLTSPTTNFLRALHFADSLTGWVAGDSGLIIHTTNGGMDWIQQQSNINSNIKDIFFLKYFQPSFQNIKTETFDFPSGRVCDEKTRDYYP